MDAAITAATGASIGRPSGGSHADSATDALPVRELKTRVYRRLCCILACYPVLLLSAAVLGVAAPKKDLWQFAFLRLVMLDIWMLAVLGPAACSWMPGARSVSRARATLSLTM